MNTTKTILSLTLSLGTCQAFANLSPEQIAKASSELSACSVKLRGDNDLATLRISIDATGAPDWEVGALQNLLREQCKLSDEAVELLDREEYPYLRTERFNATIQEQEPGAPSPEKGNSVIKLYGDFGDFYILPDIGDMLTVIHHRAD